MQRNQWLAFLLAIVLFCSGIGVGVLWHRYYANTVNAKRSSDEFRDHYVSEMRSKLNLTAAQVDQLNAILDETKAKYKAARDACHPALVTVKEDHVRRVKSILTSGQVPVYERLVAEHERKAREQERRERQDELKNATARHEHTAAH
jgi:hypothetical protein